MKSVVKSLNSKDMPRIRIGIGGIKDERQDLMNFVLQKFTKNEIASLEDVFSKAEEKFVEFLDN